MKKDLKRQLFAWLLLLVFVPMTALSALHVHEGDCDDTTLCSACINHQAHAGHLTAGIHTIHDCLLCQFLSLTFVAAAAVMTTSFIIQRRVRIVECEALYVGSANRLHSTRAPPFCE